MRVAHVAPTAFGDGGLFGGGERYPLELSRALARDVPCRLVTFGREAAHVRDANGLEVVVLAARTYAGGHSAHPRGTGLVRALHGADIVHAHQLQSRTTAIALLSAKARGQHRVVTDHGLRGRAGTPVGRLVERFLTVSRYSAEVLNAPSHRTVPIFGGADTRRFSPEPEDQRKGVLFVGRITPHKGLDRLIPAMPAGQPLTIVGSTGHDAVWPERDYPALLRRLAASSGAHITFAGTVPDDQLPRLMRRHTVLALPSVERTCYGRPVAVSELLGLTAIEAMASGTPVVASRVGGVPEVVQHRHTGLLVPPGDIAALHDALATVLDDRTRRQAMGRAGVDVVHERFTWAACASRCLQSYDTLVAGPAQPSAAA